MIDQSAIRRMIGKVIRWAVTDTGINDSGDLPVAPVTYKRRGGDSVQMMPWGFHSSPPAEILSALLTIDGAVDARAHMPISGPKRPRLASGEVTVYHEDSGGKVHFKKDGSVEVNALGNVIVSSVSGTISATSTTGIILTAPLVVVNGALQVTGNATIVGALAVTLDAVFGGAITDSNGINHVDHEHRVPFTSGPGDTDGPQSP